MRKMISIIAILILSLTFAAPASAFQFGFQVNNGNAAVIFDFSDNRQENQYYEPRPRNQWDDNNDWRYQSRQSNRWHGPDTYWGPAPIECTRNISYDRRLGYVDQRTGRPCL